MNPVVCFRLVQWLCAVLPKIGPWVCWDICIWHNGMKPMNSWICRIQWNMKLFSITSMRIWILSFMNLLFHSVIVTIIAPPGLALVFLWDEPIWLLDGEISYPNFSYSSQCLIFLWLILVIMKLETFSSANANSSHAVTLLYSVL